MNVCLSCYLGWWLEKEKAGLPNIILKGWRWYHSTSPFYTLMSISLSSYLIRKLENQNLIFPGKRQWPIKMMYNGYSQWLPLCLWKLVAETIGHSTWLTHQSNFPKLIRQWKRKSYYKNLGIFSDSPICWHLLSLASVGRYTDHRFYVITFVYTPGGVISPNFTLDQR